SAPATVLVNIFEDRNVMFFVDGDNGDDETGTGSRENPFASINKALASLTNLEDIYVKTREDGATYDEAETTLTIPAGTSLYGGYNGDWIRDATDNKTLINTDHLGAQF